MISLVEKLDEIKGRAEKISERRRPRFIERGQLTPRERLSSCPRRRFCSWPGRKSSSWPRRLARKKIFFLAKTMIFVSAKKKMFLARLRLLGAVSGLAWIDFPGLVTLSGPAQPGFFGPVIFVGPTWP